MGKHLNLMCSMQRQRGAKVLCKHREVTCSPVLGNQDMLQLEMGNISRDLRDQKSLPGDIRGSYIIEDNREYIWILGEKVKHIWETI